MCVFPSVVTYAALADPSAIQNPAHRLVLQGHHRPRSPTTRRVCGRVPPSAMFLRTQLRTMLARAGAELPEPRPPPSTPRRAAPTTSSQSASKRELSVQHSQPGRLPLEIPKWRTRKLDGRRVRQLNSSSYLGVKIPQLKKTKSGRNRTSPSKNPLSHRS